MHVTKVFEVDRSRDAAIEVLDRDETLPRLFPGWRVKIVAKQGDRKTIEAEYTALGQEGTATFHFDFLMDGSIRFQKVCDGNVWSLLRGEVEIDELEDERARVQIEMQGSTKPLVPEFTIKGPLRDQLEEMARALRDEIEDASGS